MICQLICNLKTRKLGRILQVNLTDFQLEKYWFHFSYCTFLNIWKGASYIRQGCQLEQWARISNLTRVTDITVSRRTQATKIITGDLIVKKIRTDHHFFLTFILWPELLMSLFDAQFFSVPSLLPLLTLDLVFVARYLYCCGSIFLY